MNKNELKTWLKKSGYKIYHLQRYLYQEMLKKRIVISDSHVYNATYGKIKLNPQEIKLLIKFGIPEEIFNTKTK
jgi:hypothetical protein